VIAGVAHIQRKPVLRRAEHRDRQGPAHADGGLSHDNLLGRTVVAREDDDRAEPIAGHLPAELFQPGTQQPGKDIVFGVHDERVRLAQAANPAKQGRRDHAPALPGRSKAQGVRLDRIEAENVVHPVPFDGPERLEDRRTRRLRLVQFLRMKELDAHFALTGGIRLRGRRTEQRTGRRRTQEPPSSKPSSHDLSPLHFGSEELGPIVSRPARDVTAEHACYFHAPACLL
jgi:hypothetical protein